MILQKPLQSFSNFLVLTVQFTHKLLDVASNKLLKFVLSPIAFLASGLLLSNVF
jgi:hypothetical protein